MHFLKFLSVIKFQEKFWTIFYCPSLCLPGLQIVIKKRYKINTDISRKLDAFQFNLDKIVFYGSYKNLIKVYPYQQNDFPFTEAI